MRFLDDPGARKLARECNEYSAKLAADSKGRFGMFAAMPMPYVEATLQELAYSLDTLKAALQRRILLLCCIQLVRQALALFFQSCESAGFAI